MTREVLFSLALATVLSGADLQRVMNAAMRGRQGAAVAMDPESGRIVASFRLDVAARRLARPGSVIKPFTMMAVWESARTLPCPGKLRIGGRQMDCTHPRSPVPFDGVAALAYSCNFYFASKAAAIRDAELVETFTRAGLISRTGLYEGEAAGEIVTPASIEARELLALGEANILVTPLALASAYRKLAIGRKGVVFEGLRAATEYGTARLAQPAGMKIAGKTGTALDPASGRVNAWFAGWGPAESPRIVVVVFLEQGVGGRDAAPVARKIFESAGSL